MCMYTYIYIYIYIYIVRVARRPVAARAVRRRRHGCLSRGRSLTHSLTHSLVPYHPRVALATRLVIGLESHSRVPSGCRYTDYSSRCSCGRRRFNFVRIVYDLLLRLRSLFLQSSVFICLSYFFFGGRARPAARWSGAQSG